LAVTALGFAAGRWRKGDLNHLHEWGLGGRRLGSFMTWFLLGGDLYTAYTFIGLPSLVYGAGALGFFAVPFTILIYPILYSIYPRVWRFAQQSGCVTAADIVAKSTGSRELSLAIAITGIVATLPSIALNLVGIQVVLSALGVEFEGWLGEAPLFLAFLILAAFTYNSGLRAPAVIAVVKDVLVYSTMFFVLFVVVRQLGGPSQIFDAVPKAKLLLAVPAEGIPGSFFAYASLALGSALGLFLYPFAMTGILSASGPDVLRRNAIALPAYTLMLSVMSLMGFMAIAAGVDKAPEFSAQFARFGANFAVPALFLKTMPTWMTGVAFAAIAIGALVPAAMMSIGTANIFSRNIYRAWINPSCSDAAESRAARWASVAVKFGALLVIFYLPVKFAIDMQLLGGVWNIQTLPSVLLALYFRGIDRRALLAGWMVGIGLGTWMAFSAKLAPVFPLSIAGHSVPIYSALLALIANIAVVIVLSLMAALWRGSQRTVMAGAE
jgi:SSS family solute:Na+ symporter